jgi:hypothetical protein
MLIRCRRRLLIEIITIWGLTAEKSTAAAQFTAAASGSLMVGDNHISPDRTHR